MKGVEKQYPRAEHHDRNRDLYNRAYHTGGLIPFLGDHRPPGDQASQEFSPVKEGDYTVRVQVETRDEVGDLCEAFNGMAEEIDRLVNQVYSVELKEKEAAIKALQAQINPHFLYNTLDMIKSMAELNGPAGV